MLRWGAQPARARTRWLDSRVRFPTCGPILSYMCHTCNVSLPPALFDGPLSLSLVITALHIHTGTKHTRTHTNKTKQSVEEVQEAPGCSVSRTLSAVCSEQPRGPSMGDMCRRAIGAIRFLLWRTKYNQNKGKD